MFEFCTNIFVHVCLYSYGLYLVESNQHLLPPAPRKLEDMKSKYKYLYLYRYVGQTDVL